MTVGVTVTLLSANLQHKMSNHESCKPHCIKLKIITYHLAKLHETEHYCVNSESGVKFQVTK